MSGHRLRSAARRVALDRSLELLPLFRLGDSPEAASVVFTTELGARWRVLPAPGDRLPGTFDQDVYLELMRRYHEAGAPDDGAVSFTLHAFLRSMGRPVDGRSYEQLRSALGRLERTLLESSGAYHIASKGLGLEGQFTLLTSVSIERRRKADRDQLPLFDTARGPEPGTARAVFAPVIRANIRARHTVMLSVARYRMLASPVARRLYRLLEAGRAEGRLGWRVALDCLKDMLPLSQRYPSHLQRVLQPAHELLLQVGVVRRAAIYQQQRRWYAEYVLGSHGSGKAALGPDKVAPVG